MQLHVVATNKEAPPLFVFLAKNVVKVMNYGKDEDEKVVAHGKLTNVEGSILHGVIMFSSCMSLEVQRSHNKEYVLFKSIDLDDPSIKKIGEATKSSKICPIEFL